MEALQTAISTAWEAIKTAISTALEAIKFLLGRGELLTGRMLHFDGMRMTVSETVLPEKSPYCRACGIRADAETRP
jgi:phage-related protein